MLVRNVNSYSDLETKRQLNLQLLNIEAQNEAENERRLQDYNNPNKPLPVPPQYRTNSQIKADKLAQERTAIQNVEELGFPYNEAGEVVAWLSNNGNSEKLVKFNATFKGIKKELTETTNPKLLNTEFLKNYLDRYFEDLDVNFGHKFSRGDISGKPLPRTIEELQKLFPTADMFLELRQLIINAFLLSEGANIGDDPSVFGLYQDLENNYLDPLENASNLIPSEDLLSYLRASLTQQERGRLISQLSSIARKIHLPSLEQVEELIVQITEIVNNFDTRDFEIFMSKIKRIISFLTETNLTQIYAVIEPYVDELQSGALGNATAQQLQQNIQLQINTANANAIPAVNPPQQLPPAVAKKYSRGLDNPKSIASKEKNLQDFITGLDALQPPTRGQQVRSILQNLYDEGKIDNGDILTQGLTISRAGRIGLPTNKIDDGINLLTSWNSSQIIGEPNYNPVERPTIFYQDANGSRSTIGLGITEKVIKHFKKDNKEMKALKKSYDKHIKTEDEVDDGSSSSGSESDNEKSGGRIKFKHKRIKVGGGVKIRERPTYTHFGKYIIHLPYLMDKNLLNLKYPSMGSIPSIKPITISDDYKDFVLDVLENGKVNERQLKKLPDHEIKHFEKIVSGAGLNEVLNLKRGNTEQEKKDLDRYYLLRGEIDAGNNADKVIKELRGLIVKFMNDGRVHKSEGLNLLMELSVM
jgi:hypothetical protein